MEFYGEAKSLSLDYESGQTLITFATGKKIGDVESEFIKLKGKAIDVVAKIHREKRSLSANAYFHILVEKIAESVGASNTYAKNKMICDFGQCLIMDDDIVSIKTQMPPDVMMEQDTMHCKYVGFKVENDKSLYFYNVMRGSSTYDTKEMARLIDGTVEQAKELGIETMTPAQLSIIKERWKSKDAPTI